MAENQTAWNSNKQGIKEKINQNNQTSRSETRQTGGQREPAARQCTGRAGVAERTRSEAANQAADKGLPR